MTLAEWREFFIMIGTAAGVLVGATFVVASLTADVKERRLGLAGFITPTAVHLGSVLVGSAVLAAPTMTPLGLAVLLGGGGAGGAVYALIVARRIWHLPLDLADRSFYIALPIVCYVALVAAAALIFRLPEEALDLVAVTMVVLLVTGMRNAWDMATFMITR